MEAKGQLTYQWIQWPSVVTYWLSVEWWLSIGYLSVGCQSIGQVSTDISTNHQSTFGQQKVTIVPVVCPQCTGIGEPLVEYQYISVVYWSSIVSAETNLVPWLVTYYGVNFVSQDLNIQNISWSAHPLLTPRYLWFRQSFFNPFTIIILDLWYQIESNNAPHYSRI